MSNFFKMQYGNWTKYHATQDLGPINTWTIPSTTQDVVSYSSEDTISLNGKGGHYETCYKAFTVERSGQYTISYDYNLPTVNFYGTDTKYMHFGIFISTNEPPGGNMSTYADYTSGNCNGYEICGPSSQNNSPGVGSASFTYNLTADVTYYLWIPMMNLADGVQTYLTFTNLKWTETAESDLFEPIGILSYENWNGYVCYTVETIEWDTWDRVTYTDTSWQSTLVKDQSNNGTVTISTASQFVNFGNNVTSFYTSNSLSSLTVNITRHFKFNDITNLTSAQEVYTNLSSSGVKANTNANGFMLIDSANLKMTINGNGHILSGLYCTSNGGNSGSFIRGGSNTGVLTFNDFTFDRCLFRSNGQATSGFSMINGGTSLTTYFVNFNKCAIVSESTSNYQAIMFGFLNSNSSTTYNHTQTSFFKCGFKGSRSWSNYSCGDGGISNWTSSPRFNSKWTDCTYIEPVKLGGNGTMYLLAGNRANLTQTGTNTYYNLGTGITAQGTSVNSVETAISTFNNTTLAVSRPNFTLVLSNDNLYHKVEI